MGMVQVNGQRFEVPDGSSISVVGNKILVDGQPIAATFSDSNVEIKIEGPVGSINAEKGDVHIVGEVKGSVVAGGSVHCGDISHGSVNAGGSVVAKYINGPIYAGGSVVQNRT